MAYSTSADVLSIVDTDMSAVEVTNIITWVDAVIDKRIDTGSQTAAYLENLSATYAAWRVMLKDPDARSLGEYSENRATALKLLKDEVDMLFEIADGLNFIAARSEMV